MAAVVRLNRAGRGGCPMSRGPISLGKYANLGDLLEFGPG